MTDLPDFEDRNAVEAWLKGQPREVSVTLAARSALRVLPNLVDFLELGGDIGKKTPPDILMTFNRAILTSAVASGGPTAEVKVRSAALSAALSALSARSAADSAALSAALSVRSAALSAARSAADSAARSAARSAALSALSADSAALSAARSDAEQLSVGQKTAKWVLESPLWPDEPCPPAILSNWHALSERLSALGPNWGFWIDWYQRHLDSRPHNWDLLEQIVLIDDADWDQGADHVNQIIADLELKTATRAFPYPAELRVDPADGLIYEVPIPVEDLPTYDRVLARVEQALDGDAQRNFLGGHWVVGILRDALGPNRDDKQRVHDDFVECRNAIDGDIKEGYLPDNSFGKMFVQRLDDAALNIRRTNPDVAETVAENAQFKLRETDEEKRKEFDQRLEIILPLVKPALRESMVTDHAALDKDLADIPAGEARKPRMAGYRLAYRALGVASAIAAGTVTFTGAVGDISGFVTLIRTIFGI